MKEGNNSVKFHGSSIVPSGYSYVCMKNSIYICMYTHISIYIYMYIYICIHTHTYVCVFIVYMLLEVNINQAFLLPSTLINCLILACNNK